MINPRCRLEQLLHHIDELETDVRVLGVPNQTVEHEKSAETARMDRDTEDDTGTDTEEQSSVLLPEDPDPGTTIAR
ncbi:MAG: hypothetical protein KC457_24655 [Myxococcales bacterium]|nr:hypothetical protein [Myxococcales bacterium]